MDAPYGAKWFALMASDAAGGVNFGQGFEEVGRLEIVA